MAKEFTRGHRGIVNKEPVVLTATIESKDVALVLDDRKEAEVVTWLFVAARELEEVS